MAATLFSPYARRGPPGLTPKRVARGDRALLVASCLGIAAAEAADRLTPHDVVFGSLIVAIVAIASLTLPRTVVGAVVACAVIGRAIAAAAGTISPAGAALDCAVVLGVALTLLWINARQAATDVTAYCPLKDRPIAVTRGSFGLGSVPSGGSSPTAAVSRPACALLSPRETEVIGLALCGLTARQVGEHLHLGERTVETYLARVYSKCMVSSKAELAALILDQTAKEHAGVSVASTDS